MGFMAAIAAVGAAVSVGGLAMQYDANQDAQRAAQQQTFISQQQARAAAQFSQQEQGINIRGAELSVQGAERSQAINKEILGLERRVERQRFQAMNLDARRRSLEILRLQQRARSQALSVATAQGAGQGSGLQGAYGGISGQTGVNYLGVQQNLQIGRNIFGLNSQITDQRVGYSDLIADLARQQAALTTEKSNLLASYAQTQAGLQTQYSAAGGRLASAQGQAAIGGSLVGAGQSIFSFGSNIYNNMPGSTSPTNAFGGGYINNPASGQGIY